MKKLTQVLRLLWMRFVRQLGPALNCQLSRMLWMCTKNVTAKRIRENNRLEAGQSVCQSRQDEAVFLIWSLIPAVASVVSASVRFRGKVEEGGTGFLLLAVQKMDREPKNGKGRRRGKKKNDSFLSPPQPPSPTPSFTPPIFRGVFLAPEPHGNDCCAGYTSCLHRRFPNNSKLQLQF